MVDAAGDNFMNYMGRLTDASQAGKEADNNPIVHRVLQLAYRPGPRPILEHNFFSPEDPVLGKDIRDFAKQLPNNPTNTSQRVVRTPFDIKVTKPSFVLLELEEGLNWHFTPGSRGVTTKLSNVNHPGAHFGPFFITPGPGDGIIHETASVPNRCNALYFLLARQDASGKPASFNFHISFYQEVGGVRTELPIIYDPDIGNDGGKIP